MLTAQERKERPLYSGVLKYFPDALLEVAHCSFVGNEQHNTGQPLHWDRSKSTDEADACVRHLLEAGTRDTDGVRHAAKAAWRALALLQKEIETERQAAPLAQPHPSLSWVLDTHPDPDTLWDYMDFCGCHRCCEHRAKLPK
jgi:hypothetical protein